MDNEIITTKEAAEILEITQEAVARLLRVGKIKGQKLGRDWVVFKSSVEEYLSTTTQKSKFDPTRGKNIKAN